MASNVFISYDHDNYSKKNGFLALNNNPNHPLDFHDHSLKEPVRDKNGNILRYSPANEKSKPVRDEIMQKFDRASRLVVLIGNDTRQSEWVNWEISTFYHIKFKVDGENTWKRIRGMYLKDRTGARIPSELNGKSTKAIEWDPVAIDTWLSKEL